MTATQANLEEPRAREYETIYILRPNVDPDEADRIANRVREVIAGMNAKLLRIDNWGRRKLAYSIGKASRGVFVYVRFVGLNDVVAEIERNLRLIDDVIRHQTVLLKDKVRVEEYGEVEAADLEFSRLEQATEEEIEEPELAARLGLVERPRADAPEREAPEAEASSDDESGGAGDSEDES